MSADGNFSMFNQAVLMLLEATFEESRGIFLDRGTSIFETLATISAAEASIPTSTRCASIAAHVEHMRFYMEATLKFLAGDRTRPDWGEIWRTVQEVSPEEWAESQRRLRKTVQKVRELINSTETWANEMELGGAMGLLMHNAYHLGEIRHALCQIKLEKS
jgi:hypothetical protein